MFKDYYLILEVPSTSTLLEIKTAYRKQCIKWHPDKNPEIDTTERMQEIVEAYLILKDSEAKERYDKEYLRYKRENKKSNRQTQNNKTRDTGFKRHNFYVSDETLKRWMQNANRQSKEVLADIIDEFRGALVEGGKSIMNYVLTIMIPMLLGFLFVKACSG